MFNKLKNNNIGYYIHELILHSSFFLLHQLSIIYTHDKLEKWFSLDSKLGFLSIQTSIESIISIDSIDLALLEIVLYI